MSRLLLSGSLVVLMSLSALAAEEKAKPERVIAQPAPAQPPEVRWWENEPAQPPEARWWEDEPAPGAATPWWYSGPAQPSKLVDAKRADKPLARGVATSPPLVGPPRTFAPSVPPLQPRPAAPAVPLGQPFPPGPMMPPPSTFPSSVMVAPAPPANHQRKIYRVKHLPAIDLAEAISQVIEAERPAVPTPPVMIVPEVITNSLVINGPAPAVESAIELAEQLDVQPKMVQIRVLMAEIHADDDDAKGIGALLARLSNPDGSEDFDEVAAAIAGMPGVRLLGGPQLTLLDNQPGFLQIGQRVPRITGASASSRGLVRQVSMENVGLILSVTARINDDGLVTMEVDLEKSQLGPADEGASIAVPTEGDPIRATQVETLTCQSTIAVRDGRVTVLGGLASRDGEMVILISPRIVEP